MSADIEQDRTLALLAAMLEGDRVLTREGSAVLLSMPLRTFDKLASAPDFPKPAKLGRRLTWRRRELLAWWDRQRDTQNAA